MYSTASAMRYRKPMLIDKLTQKQLADYMPPDDILEGLTEFFSVLGDKTRIRILSALSITGMCVTDIATMLDMNQTTVSHQLRLLKSAGAVTCRRQGKVIFYSLASEKLNDVMLAGVEFLGY